MLYSDIRRQRGNQYRDLPQAPNVLDYGLVMSGMDLPPAGELRRCDPRRQAHRSA
ncbi:MAG: DUF3141 domain-containing protein [Chiayiivirga sp.]|nr:DUF3141 domain-containing protein [Chiayiivirga sp.]